MRRILTASLQGHARRFVSGGIAIVLSVAYVAAVLIAVDTMKQALQDAVGEQFERADLVVKTHDEMVDAKVADQVRAVPGVEAVSVNATTYLETSFPNGSNGFSLVAPVPQDSQLRWQEASSGRLPARAGEIAVAVGVAKDKAVKVGSVVSMHANDKAAQKFTVVGIVSSSSITNAGDFFLPEKQVATFYEGPAWGSLLVRTSGTADADAVAAAAGKGATVRTAEAETTETLKQYTGDIDLLGGLLLGFAAVAMFVALLVVANTFTIMIAQRARELALFRCVGAAKGQVFRAVLAESLALGAGFSLLGAVLGIGLAQIGMQAVGRFTDFNLPLDVVAIRPMALVIPIVIGMVTTVAAALAPARRATRVPPLAALHPEAAIRVRSKPGVVRLVFGALLLLAGGGLLAVGMQGATGPTGMLVGISGGVVSFLGVLLFAPILAPAVVRLLGLLARAGGVPGKVAVGNAVRNPRRTAATASALLVGVTLICMLVVGAASSQATVAKTLNEQYPFDLVVSAPGGQAIENEKDAPAALPASVVSSVSAVDGVTDVLAVQGATGMIDGRHAGVINGIDQKQAARVVRNGRPIDGLRDGVVVLSPSMAGSLSKQDGAQVSLRVGSQTVELRARVINEMNTPDIMVTTADLRRLTDKPVVTSVWARTADNAEVKPVVDGMEAAVVSVPDTEVGGSFAERALYATIVDILLAIATGLLAIAVAIALVGVGNTLSLSVLERTRENALLRALGLTRRQLRGTLAVEALLIAGSAVLIGFGLGVLYGYAGTAALLGGVQAVSGVELTVPWSRIGLIVLVALGAGALASVLPARRAVKVPPAAALGE